MIDIQALKNMESFKLKNYKKGDIIVQEGMKEIDDSMYILLKGSVEVWKNHQMDSAIKMAVLNPGEFFGEMTLFLRKERSATIVAAEDTVAAEINTLDSYEFFEKQPEATYMLISTLCRRLHNLNEMYNKIMGGGIPASINAREEQPLSSIFPKGHRQYNLAIDAPADDVYSDKSYACPMCKNVFRYITARDHMLKPSHTDKDFRVHYKNAEPVYYEIVTCPQCWYSAFGISFEKGIASRSTRAKDAVEKFKTEAFINVEKNKNISDIFASYYLALECANICFMPSEMIIAKIWLRLSWLYHDCGDGEMEHYASDQACQAYKETYSNMELNMKQLDQVCLIIGELCLKLGDIKTAREFFFQVKKNRSEYHSYIAQADDRLAEIKEMLKQE